MDNGQQINGTAVLQAKLNDPDTVAALTRLLDRLDSIEETVDKLTTAVEHAPAFVSMATDTVDDAYRQAAEQGIDLDERIRLALSLAERMTTPEMVEQLDRFLTLVEQAPGLAAMVTDTVDDAYRTAQANGINIDERLRMSLALVEKLTTPEMIERLDRLVALADQAPGLISMVTDTIDDAYMTSLAYGVDPDARMRAALEMAEKLTAPDMLAKLDRLIELANNGPGIMAMVVDTIDDAYRQATLAGFNPEQLVQQGMLVTSRMAELLESGEINALFDSGVIDPKAVEVVGGAAQALVKSRSQPVPQMGFFAMLKTMRDPDVQRALGFLTLFGKEFGKNLQE